MTTRIFTLLLLLTAPVAFGEMKVPDALLTGDATVPAGATLTIASGGTLSLAEGATITGGDLASASRLSEVEEEMLGRWNDLAGDLASTNGELAAEAVRAMGVEDGLGGAIAQEAARALASEELLDQRITNAEAGMDAELGIERTARQDGDASLANAIAANAAAISALNGVGGLLAPHDFGTDVPSVADLTEYFARQVWDDAAGSGVFTFNAADPAQSTLVVNEQIHLAGEVWNATSVINSHNQHEIKLNNTRNTSPPIFEFIDMGQAFVSVANAEAAGVVKSGVADGQVAVDTAGVMSVNGWSGVVRLTGAQVMHDRKTFYDAPYLVGGMLFRNPAVGHKSVLFSAGGIANSDCFRIELPTKDGTVALTSDITDAASDYATAAQGAAADTALQPNTAAHLQSLTIGGSAGFRMVRAVTTDTTPVLMTPDGGASSLIVPGSSILIGDVRIVGVAADG
ncbi:MAG: hypothetical protein LBK99_25340, partial [Opitutaceae bacterium]|nr:hypothetical protein [Opitutaceae bacterium]